MHKSLLLLGLLLSGPKTGYDLHRIVRGHGDFYADLKKANVYYLLERLARDGYLTVEAEAGARGPRGERLIYSITEPGRARFGELLRRVLSTFELVPNDIGPAIVFLNRLPTDEAIQLLEQRRVAAHQQRSQLAALRPPASQETRVGLAVDRLLALTDADLAWTDRTLERLRAGSLLTPPNHPAGSA